jgi:hypothetical protein
LPRIVTRAHNFSADPEAVELGRSRRYYWQHLFWPASIELKLMYFSRLPFLTTAFMAHLEQTTKSKSV